MQIKLREPTMAIGYSLRMCARHVDSTNSGRSNLVFRSKPTPEAEMSNRLISLQLREFIQLCFIEFIFMFMFMSLFRKWISIVILCCRKIRIENILNYKIILLKRELRARISDNSCELKT